MAEEPNNAEPPPRITSTRSIILAGICSNPYTPAKALNIGREVNQYLRIRAIQPIDTYLLETTVLTIILDRTPGWKFSPCDNVEEFVFSNTFTSITFTNVGAMRRVVSLRLADTTTPSNAIRSSSISKFSSKVFPFLKVTFRLTVL